MTPRGTTNTNVRGSAASRRARRLWLLTVFGDGVTARCMLGGPHCLGRVDITTLTVDRIVPGRDGGTYRRGNIVPACGPCNYGEGGQVGAARKWVKLADTAPNLA